jgi:hypothetical protein
MSREAWPDLADEREAVAAVRMLLEQAAAMHAGSTTGHPADAEGLRAAYRELLDSEGWPADLADLSPQGEVVVIVPPEQYGWLSGGC